MKLIALTPFVSIFGSIALAADLPKYSLPVGRHLAYSSQSSEKEAGAEKADTYRNDFDAFVLAKNADGSAHVVVESSTHFGPGSERVTFGYADIFPDGHYTPNRTVGPSLAITPIFPLLPANDDELKSMEGRPTGHLKNGNLSPDQRCEWPVRFHLNRRWADRAYLQKHQQRDGALRSR